MDPDASLTDDAVLSIDDLLDTGRMREQLDIARRIQRGFLPKTPPGLHGFEIEGWNDPCHEAGGDYYDYLRLPGGRLGIAIGDVASHGIGPALLMANARSALRALLRVSDSPGQVLERLNDALVEDMLEDHFMTMFVGVLDLNTRLLRYAIAGHERPLLLRNRSDEFVRLEAKGMPLGIRAGISYPEGKTERLRNGDILVCITDGIWEATNASGEEFGYERLQAVLLSNRRASAAGLLDAVQKAVLEFAGSTRQIDDLTMMALKVL